MSWFRRREALPLVAATIARQNNEGLRDEQLARQLQEQEHNRQLETDRRFAQSLDEGIEGLFSQRELQIARDHELALQLVAENVGGDGEDEELEDEPAVQLAGDRVAGNIDRATCTACADEHPRYELATTACDHLYCATCLSRIFRQAMTDEAYFPPRCCQREILLNSARAFIGPQLSAEFELKAVELTTADRTYCHIQNCSAFIPPASIREDVAHCGTCGEDTCSMCKAAIHGGDCPQDLALQQVVEEAQRQGWRRCECGRYIELYHGCNHMTCVCRREFCYVCGARWRTCGCAQWDEQRLYNRAEEVANRHPALIRRQARGQQQRQTQLERGLQQQREAQQQAQAMNPQQQYLQQVGAFAPRPGQDFDLAHQARVREIAQQLRENHECTHSQQWRRFKGYHMCPVCGRQKKDVVGECKICFLVACYPCRRHRL